MDSLSSRQKIISAALILLLAVISLCAAAEDSYAEITGAPTDLKTSELAEGETSLKVSWTPNLTCGIDRDSTFVLEMSTDNKSTWEVADAISFSYGAADLSMNSYANTSSTSITLEYGKTYYFRAYYIDISLNPGPYSDIAGPVECKEKSAPPEDPGNGESGSGDSGSGSGSGDSGSGSGSGSGGSSGISVEAPDPTKCSCTFPSYDPSTITASAIAYWDSDVYAEIMMDDEVIMDQKLGYSTAAEVTKPVRYDRSYTFKYRFYRMSGTSKAATEWTTVTIKSSRLTRPSLSVTKISGSKAGLKWNAVAGATGFRIYNGRKVIKTVAGSKTSFIYSKKGAGKGKYKVVPVIKVNGMSKAAAGPASKAVKGKANVRKYVVNKSIKSVTYGHAPFKISKIALTENKYKITGYAVNNRIFKLIKYKKLKITIYCNGKKVASKTFKNLKVNCKDSGTKKMTLTIKGKGGVDFRNAEGQTYYATWTPYWKVVGSKEF